MAFAALGAVEILRRRPDHSIAAALCWPMRSSLIGDVADDPSWYWPEWRLRYANAVTG